MSHVADSPKKRHFVPISGRFTPIRPTNHRRERNGPPTAWHPGNVGGSHRPPGHCSPASRPTLHTPRSTPDQRGEVVRRTSPAGYYAGKKVGQAFQPDGINLSGWKA